MGVPCDFCSRCWALSVLWYQQKEMQFGIEMREHGVLPKPTPGMVRGWGSSAHGEKAKEETVAWGELHPGHYSSSPGWGISHRATGRFTYFPSHSHGAPHLSAAVSETAWPPAASLLCTAAAEQRRTPALLLHRRSGASSTGESRGTITLPGIHLPAASSCQDTLPRCRSGAEKGPCIPLPIRLHLLCPRDRGTVCGASQLWHWAGHGGSPVVHTRTHACAHTCSSRPAAFPFRGRLQRLSSHS